MQIFLYTPLAQSPERATEAAKEAEALGYDGLAMPDHLFVPSFNGGEPQPYAHALTVLAAVAASTTRIRLLTLVAKCPARSPVELAHAVSTLQQLSQDRVELGLGAGWFRAEFEGAGLAFPSPTERLGRLAETVQICRMLFAGGSAQFEGRYFRVDLPAGSFMPCHPPPIVLGGAAPRSVRTAARLGDRVDLQPNALAGGNVDLAAYNTYAADDLATQVATVREVEASTGRRVPVSESPFIAVEADARRGRERRQALAGAYGVAPEVMDRSLGTVVGCAEEVAERLAAYADAGCDRVNLQSLDGASAARLAPHLPQLHALEARIA